MNPTVRHYLETVLAVELRSISPAKWSGDLDSIISIKHLTEKILVCTLFRRKIVVEATLGQQVARKMLTVPALYF